MSNLIWGERRGWQKTTYYLRSWQLLIIATAALVMSARVVRPEVALPAFVAAFAVLSPLGLALHGLKQKRLATLTIALVLIALAFYHGARIQRLEDFVQGMIELICGALPLLLLNHDQSRSYWLGILTLVIVGVGSISLGSSLLVYGLFFAQLGLILLNMNAANLYLPDRHGAHRRELLPRGYFTQFMLVMPVGGLAAAFIFVTFPRVQSFTLALTSAVGGRRTGYSGLVSLNGGGELTPSQALALIVEASDTLWLQQTYAALLLRGEALDAFDGVHWTAPPPATRAAEQQQDLRSASQHGNDIHMLTIHQEVTGDATLFYPEVLLSAAPVPITAAQIQISGQGTISRQPLSSARVTYELRTVSALSAKELPSASVATLYSLTPDETEDETLSVVAQEHWEYLRQLPRVVSEAEYFKAWMQEVALDPARASLGDVQQRLSQLFTQRFTATLANDFDSEQALATFLSTQRQGHCEYFATSATLTLRALGIPARLVVGYRGGTYSPWINALEVRDEDAHAWVEVYVPGVGWHAYDPTPSIARSASNLLSSRLRLAANGLSFWFRRYVVDYDQSTQQSLWQSLQIRPNLSHGTLSVAWLKDAARPIALGALTLFGLWWVARRLRRQKAAPQLPAYYQTFVLKMNRLGLTRRSGETYRAFHLRLKASHPQVEDIAAIDLRLERDLYRGP